MDKNTDRQFQAARAAIEHTVSTCMSDIDKVKGRWEDVAPSYIVEAALLALCNGMIKLIDDPGLAGIAGPAAVKLSNALLDYRNSRWSER